MKSQHSSREPFFGALMRRLLLFWLLSVGIGLLAMPAEVRRLEGLSCVAAMPVWLIPGLTLSGTGLMFLLSRYKDTRQPERWAMVAAFALAMGAGLWVSFTWAFLTAGLVILAMLVAYALRGRDTTPEPAAQTEQTHPVWPCLTLGLALAFFLLVAAWTVARVTCFSSYTYDFGIFSQMFHYMKETGLPLTTLERDGLLSHFHVHVSPVYYLMLPFYCLVPRPETLQVLQAAVLASGVLPLWKLGKLHGLTGLQRTLVCGLLLLQPALAGGAAYDLHENCFLTPLLLWLLYGLERSSLPVTLTATVLTLCIKEDAAVYVAVAGLFFLLKWLVRKEDRSRKALILSLSVLGMALVWFALVTGYLSRVGKGVMSWRYDNLMFESSGSLLTVVKAVVLNPVKALFECMDREKLAYLARTLLPLLGLPLVTRRYERLVLLIPFVLVNLLTDYTYQYSIFHQYGFGSLAFLVYLSLVNLGDWRPGWSQTLALGLAVAVSWGFFGREILPKALEYPQRAQQYSQRYDAIRDALSQIPEDAAVAATTFYTTELSRREILYDVRYARQEHVLQAEYVALGLASDGDFKLYATGGENNGRENLMALLRNHGYSLWLEVPGVLVIYRKAP